MKKTVQLLTLGIDAQQWTACLLICALLSLSVAAPVGVSMPRAVNNDAETYEPVNEDLSIFTSAFRHFNAEMEATLTPWRSVNWTTSDDISGRNANVNERARSESKNANVNERANDPEDKPSTEPNNNEPKPSEHHNDRTLNESTPSSLTNLAQSVAPPMMNQIPDNEHDSIYSYENNLGLPPGQVEIDSSNRAAAVRIRHRVGIANFSFGLPLASLSGRGIDAGVGMTYNSRTWNKSLADNGNGGIVDHYVYDVEQSWIAPGFSSGFGYLESAAVVQFIHPEQSSNFTYHTEIAPLGITDPDGTRHQFSCKSWTPISGTYTSKCNTYISDDGTFITTPAQNWVSNVNNSQTPNLSAYASARFTVVYPNGSKVYYAGSFGSGNIREHHPVIMQDSNGNRIRIAYKADQSGRIDYITDTLNRQIKFYYESDTSGNPDKLVAVTIPGMSANEEIQTVRFYYETLTLNATGKFVGTVTAPATIRVLKYAYMPATKTGYKYEHDTNYGMIKKITRFVGMTASTPLLLTETGSITNEGLYAASTEYNYPDGSTPLTDVPKYTKRTDDWQGRTSTTAQETYYDAPEPAFGQDRVSVITVADNGFYVENETRSYNTTGATNGLISETGIYKATGPLLQRQRVATLSKTKYTWSTDGKRNLTRIEVTNDAGLIKATEFEYDQYNNQKKVRECDYAATGTACTDASALRRTETTYETGSGWINRNILSLPKTVQTMAGGAVVSKTLIDYDHATNGTASDATITKRDDIDIATHDTYYNPAHPAWTETICPDGQPEGQSALPGGCVIIHHPGYTVASAYRGNVTRVGRLIDVNATTINGDPNADVTDYNHDIAGNMVSASVSCCNVKTIAYDKLNEYAFPISETIGSSPSQLTTSTTYNRNTGLALTSTDENGQPTNYEYETDTLRPKKTIYPNGGYVESFYSDKEQTGTNLLPGYFRQKTTLETNKFMQSYSYFNGRGDALRSASETLNGWLISAMEYDSLGRIKKSYNPFFGSMPITAIPAGTKFSEITAIDALGRTTEVTLQDNTKVYTYPNEATVTYTGPNNQSITGTATRVKDQADKERRQIADSLGRTVRVDEPTLTGLGTASSPNQPTFYEYDSNDNLSKVIQSDGVTTQERKFKYDSLSRLIAEKQVEANATLNDEGIKVTTGGLWTGVYKYSNHSLLLEGVDARGVKTSFNYDGLNRTQSVAFTGEAGYQTPTVTYTYDEAESNFYNNGRLTKVRTAPNATYGIPETVQNYDYDKVGQVVQHIQSIDNQNYQLEYGYNLAGQLISEKYPSGRIVANTIDNFGGLSTVADASRGYLTGVSFNSQGLLSQMNLGNGTNQTFGYNDRFQMLNQSLQRGAEVLQKYDYSYGTVDLGTGSVDTSKNNGQLGKIEGWIGASKQWSQRFGYDELGRLKESREYKQGDNTQLTYKQRFDFDRFGNLYRKAANNNPAGQQNPLPYTAIEETTTPETGDIDKSTNRFRVNTTYDEAGQVVNDSKFRSMGFGYDANGRMIKATKANTPDASTVYDALGNRVATRINDVWSFTIYDAFGKLIADYGGISGTDDGGVRYVMQDWQGSPRAVVGNTGYVQSRTDFTTFGEEIQSGIGLRTAQQGYGTPTNARQGYGLTEKDDSSGLNHTWFRKNENRAGRWTSPDPYKGSMSLGDPQSFNRYSYVGNEPTNFVDPSGLLMSGGGRVCYGFDVWRYNYENGVLVSVEYLGFFATYCTGGGGSGYSGGSGAGGNGGKQTDEIPENCKKALKAAGLLKKTQAKLKDSIIDVDKIQNEPASKYFGNDGTSGLTVGQYFDAETNPGGAYTYRAGTTPGTKKNPKGSAIGKTGTYRRGGDAGMGIGLKVHEAAHRAQPKSSDLDVSLAKMLKVDTTGKTASKALTDYFNSGCDPKYLKK